MSDDFIHYYIAALPHAVYRALENNDEDLLRGLQAYEISIWTGIRGCESYLVTLIGKVFERLNFDNPNLDLASNIRIPAYEMLRACGDLRTFELFSRGLQNLGFVETRSDPTGDFTHLTPISNTVLENMKRTGIESYSFASSLGKLLGLGIIRKGLASFRPLLLMSARALNNDGELPLDQALRAYLDAGGQERKFYEMLRRDSRKAEEIRLIAINDGDRVILHRHVLRAYELLREIALDLYRTIS